MERVTEKIINKETGKVLAYKLKSNVNRIKADQKLGQYEDAEEQGLLFRVPCAEGTPVWKIHKCRGAGMTPDWYEKYKTEFLIEMTFEFGKTVFLTEEEADRALAELWK